MKDERAPMSGISSIILRDGGRVRDLGWSYKPGTREFTDKDYEDVIGRCLSDFPVKDSLPVQDRKP